MPNLINTVMPARTAGEVTTNLKAQVAIVEPFKVNLTDDFKEGSRTMGPVREGYARLVSNIANNNIESLARNQDPQALVDKLLYDETLEGMRQVILTLNEMVTETQLANTVDIMQLVDSFVGNLQNSRKTNGSLDLQMREVDEYNKRFAKKAEEPKP
jgi:hypothetical protein